MWDALPWKITWGRGKIVKPKRGTPSKLEVRKLRKIWCFTNNRGVHWAAITIIIMGEKHTAVFLFLKLVCFLVNTTPPFSNYFTNLSHYKCPICVFIIYLHSVNLILIWYRIFFVFRPWSSKPSLWSIVGSWSCSKNFFEPEFSNRFIIVIDYVHR